MRPPLSEVESAEALEEALARITAASTSTDGGPPLGFRLASAIERREITWLWNGRIPLAEVAGLAGDGGVGKSTAAQALVALATRGQLDRLPGGSGLLEPCGAVLLSVEEDAEAVVMPRLAEMGADLERVAVLTESAEDEVSALTLPSGAARLTAAARVMHAGLVVIDTGPGFLDGGLKSNAEEDVRRFFRPLARLARELRLVVLVLYHLNKGSDGAARHRVTGSAAWVNVPRSVLIMGAPPGEDPLETPERALVVVKGNLIAGKMPEAVAARLVAGRDDPTVGMLEWAGELSGVRAADLTTHVGAEERGEREDCAAALADLLAGGPQPAKECEAAMKRDGYRPTVVRHARQVLGITRPTGTIYQDAFHGPHMWRLPEVGSTDGHAPRVAL